MTSTLWLLAAGPLLVACVAPPGVLATTRTPRAGGFAGGAAAEYAVPVGQSEEVRIGARREAAAVERGIFVVRPRGWVSYGLTDRLSASVAVPVPVLAVSAQLGVQWNPIRTRYFDVAVHGRVGVEHCLDRGRFYEYGNPSGVCGTPEGRSDHYYAYTSAVALLGVNPFSWLTIQAQGGVWSRHGFDHRAGPWIGGNAYVLLGDQIAIGPDVAVLPGWFADGRALVQPSASLLFWSSRAVNPYRGPP